MQKMLKSAFKRGDSSSSSAAAVEEAELSSSASTGTTSPGNTKARPPSGRWSVRRSNDGDRSSSRESLDLDGSSSSKSALLLGETCKIGPAYESFPWEKKMKEQLPVPDASSYMSLLLLPMATDTRYNSLEDTLARADAWLASAQSSGVPVLFTGVQTEALLTKVSGEVTSAMSTVGSVSDLANMSSNVSLYGFEDYHGVDIGVLRAVRLWYAAAAGETALEIRLQQGDTRLGFAVSRTDEGFIYVSSVADESTPGVASTRSGLLELHRAARRAARLLVVSRVGGEKVLPWMVSAAGDVRCYDTVSLSQKLSLYRHALRPITLHFLAWDNQLAAAAAAGVPIQPPPQPMLTLEMPEDAAVPAIAAAAGGRGHKGSSFKFQNIGLPDSWL